MLSPTLQATDSPLGNFDLRARFLLSWKPDVRQRFCGSGERGEQGGAHLKLGRLNVKKLPSCCSSCTEEARVRLRPGPFPPHSGSGVTATLPMMQHCWACAPTVWGPLLGSRVPAAERPAPRSPPTSRWEPPHCCLDHQNQNRTVRTAEWIISLNLK